jgi:transcriptional regulator with XRE-family HTH domain
MNIVKSEFGNRLHRMIMLAGMNQSDLARRASEHMPAGKKIGRDSISSYVRGRQLPGPVHLKAICDALGVTRDELLPMRGVPHTAVTALPHLKVEDAGDGMALVQVNQMLPWADALAVMAIIKRNHSGHNGNDQ